MPDGGVTSVKYPPWSFNVQEHTVFKRAQCSRAHDNVLCVWHISDGFTCCELHCMPLDRCTYAQCLLAAELHIEQMLMTLHASPGDKGGCCSIAQETIGTSAGT